MSLSDRARQAAAAAAEAFQADQAAVEETYREAIEPQMECKAAEWFDMMGVEPQPVELLGSVSFYNFETLIAEERSQWEMDGHTFQLHAKVRGAGANAKITEWHVVIYGEQGPQFHPTCDSSCPLIRNLAEYGRFLGE